MKILFTGGGTAGHIFPIIAVFREMRRLHPEPDLQIFYVGPKDEFAKTLFSEEGINVKYVLSGKIRRYFDWKALLKNIIDIFFKLPIGVLQSFFYIFFSAPDVIFSKGGFGSIPAVVSGWLLRIPVFLHESDISPGLANRFLSKLVVEIFISFPDTEYFTPEKGKIILVGNPIRREILEGSKEKAQKLFKLTGQKPVILILGGSQGAQRINDKILEILPELLKNFEVIHQSGQKNFKQVKAEAMAILPKELLSFYHLFPFLNQEELKQAYAVCNLVVGRAGSGSIFEIAAVGKAAVLIPLPEGAQDHQTKNAYAYAKTGAAIVLEETNFTPHFFLERLKQIIFQSEQLKKMERAAKEFSRPLAAKIIAGYLVEFLK